MKRKGITPPMPPNPAPHIIDRLVEIGLVDTRGMGPAPLSWAELSAWQANTGLALSAWEARLIRRLSTEYVAEGRRAEEAHAPPPWRAPVTEREQDLERDELRAALG